MKLYCLRLLFLYIILFINKFNINGFACCLSPNNQNKEYIILNLTDKKEDAKKLKSFFDSKSKTSNDILKENDNSKEKDDNLKNEKEIIEKLEIVFKKDGEFKSIKDINKKDINECCLLLPKNIYVGYDGSKKVIKMFVISNDKDILKKYFNENIKISPNEIEEIKLNLLRNNNESMGNNLIGNILEDVDNLNLLYIIFCANNNNDDVINILDDSKSDITIYCKKNKN